MMNDEHSILTNICDRKMRGKMGKSSKNNGNVKRSPKVLLKKLTRREIQSRLRGSCKDLTMATEILAEQNSTSRNLRKQQKVKDSGDSSALNKKSSNLIEENNERVNENPGCEEDNQIKNVVSSERKSSKRDQTKNLTPGSPGLIGNNVLGDLYNKIQEQEDKSNSEEGSSVRERAKDAPNEKYKLRSKDQPSIHITREGKMVAKVILKRLTEEDIAKFTQKPKRSQTTAIETENPCVETQKETPEQDVGVEKDITMPEIDVLSSDSDFTDSVTKKRTLRRRAHKRPLVESDSESDEIVSSSSSDDDDDDDDDDYNVKEELHRTSYCDNTDSEPEQERSRAPSTKRSRLTKTSGFTSEEEIKKWKRNNNGNGVDKNEKMTFNRRNDNCSNPTQNTLKQLDKATFIPYKTNVFHEPPSYKTPLPATSADLCSSKKLSLSLLCSMYLHYLPPTNLYHLFKRCEFMIESLQKKISQIYAKPLPMLMTEIQMKDRFLSTDMTMKNALEYKLDQHITLCRLNRLKAKLMKYLLEVKLVYEAKTPPTITKPRVRSKAASYTGNPRVPCTASFAMSQRHPASFANGAGGLMGPNFLPYQQYHPRRHHVVQGSNNRFTRPPQPFQRPRPSVRPVFTDTRQQFNYTTANGQRKSRYQS